MIVIRIFSLEIIFKMHNKTRSQLLVDMIVIVCCIQRVRSITCQASSDPCRCDTDEGKVDLSSLDSGSSSSAGCVY